MRYDGRIKYLVICACSTTPTPLLLASRMASAKGCFIMNPSQLVEELPTVNHDTLAYTIIHLARYVGELKI